MTDDQSDLTDGDGTTADLNDAIGATCALLLGAVRRARCCDPISSSVRSLDQINDDAMLCLLVLTWNRG